MSSILLLQKAPSVCDSAETAAPRQATNANDLASQSPWRLQGSPRRNRRRKPPRRKRPRRSPQARAIPAGRASNPPPAKSQEPRGVASRNPASTLPRRRRRRRKLRRRRSSKKADDDPATLAKPVPSSAAGRLLPQTIPHPFAVRLRMDGAPKFLARSSFVIELYSRTWMPNAPALS
jgi:hypothetical protein